jgi:soluble lytic murein transglycosylase-like protein
MDGTARMLGVSDPFDVRQNIYAGVKYLSSLIKKFNGNIKNALAAYNAGPGAVDKYGGIPPYDETRRYVKSIMDRLEG